MTAADLSPTLRPRRVAEASLLRDRPAGPRSSTFAEMALSLSEQCRRLGLQVPFFRSPPRGGLLRSIRRGNDGSVTVAVVVRDREAPAIARDLVDGIIAANRLTGPEADEARAALRATLRPAPVPRTSATVASAA